jgi:phosphoribosylanthranilate isomerase
MFGPSEPADEKTRVKICGITNAEDALAAIEAGADALGWNFFSGSKRFIAPQRALEIIRALPKQISHVAVVVNPTLDDAVALGDSGAFAALQLHGRETEAFCEQLNARGIRFAKAVAVGLDGRIEPINGFSTDTIVLDSAAEDGFGGTGRTFPWQAARELRERHGSIRIILAGGLMPENVGNAISVVRPFGVDVTSGIEAAPGRKDYVRLRAFIAAARSARGLA